MLASCCLRAAEPGFSWEPRSDGGPVKIDVRRHGEPKTLGLKEFLTCYAFTVGRVSVAKGRSNDCMQRSARTWLCMNSSVRRAPADARR
jgi:hypothetical protein